MLSTIVAQSVPTIISPTLSYASHRCIPQIKKREFGVEVVAPLGALGIGAVMAMVNRYKVAKPNEYLAITGIMIPDIVIQKKRFIWPFQKCNILNMDPSTMVVDIHAMSSQKMEFSLPASFTIGPGNTDEQLKNYSRLILSLNQDEFTNIVRGIVEGETRVLAAQRTMEELFNNRTLFKTEIIAGVQEELSKFGLVVYNANIKDMQDHEGSEYFKHLRQKTRAGAEGTAKVDIAEALRNSEIGEKERLKETRTRVAALEAEAIEVENIAKQKIADSEALLSIRRTEAEKQTLLARIQAHAETESLKYQRERAVEEERAKKEIEMLRANDLSRVNVEAEAVKRRAEGEAHAIEIIAQANLRKNQLEAEGILANYDAQAKGIHNLLQACGDKNTLTQYLMIDRGLYQVLAQENAKAIHGLNPKITVWNTNSNGVDPIQNILKNIPPLLETINEQTGINLNGLMKPEN